MKREGERDEKKKNTSLSLSFLPFFPTAASVLLERAGLFDARTFDAFLNAVGGFVLLFGNREKQNKRGGKKTRKEGEERGRCCLSLFISLSFISILLTLFFYTNKDSATAKRDSFFAG